MGKDEKDTKADPRHKTLHLNVAVSRREVAEGFHGLCEKLGGVRPTDLAWYAIQQMIDAHEIEITF